MLMSFGDSHIRVESKVPVNQRCHLRPDLGGRYLNASLQECNRVCGVINLSPKCLDFAQVRFVRRGSADRIQYSCSDQQVEIRPVRTKRIVLGRSKRFTGLPPSMLSDDDARIEICI